MNSFASFPRANFKERFDPKLEKFIDQKIKENENIDYQLGFLLKEIKKTILAGGKRIRPAFMVLAYQACGGKDEEAIIKAACSIELLHHFALVHDDIMDNSALRRGRPSLHQSLGVPTAILAGDLLQNYAWEVLFDASFAKEVLQKAQKLFAQLTQEMIAGQYLDMQISQLRTKIVDFDKEEKRILKMLKFKSGKYSVERPCQMGAILAGASENELTVFSRYGVPLGIAFQLKDDILGTFGEEKEIGKPTDSDLKEGKVTLLIVKALEQLAKMDTKIKKKFLSIWGNQKATPQDLEWTRELIRETGSFEYSQRSIYKLASQAKQAINKSLFSQKAKEPFLEIADFLIERDH